MTRDAGGSRATDAPAAAARQGDAPVRSARLQRALGHRSFLAGAVLTALVVPASVLYGYLSARFLEQPIRRWARRYGRTVPEEAATNR